MFEIRVICDSLDIPGIARVLSRAFTTGPVRAEPTRRGGRTRLYFTADHRPQPDVAYATAPNIVSEIGWVADQAADKPFGTRMGREFWLRKAAVLDRIALTDDTEGHPADAAEAATDAALRLMDLDDTEATCDPRDYVRQQYTRWLADQ